jgi:flagellin
MLISGTDASSLLALRSLHANSLNVDRSLQRLSTGSRIPAASFDPVSLITSENFRTVLAALGTEVRAAERGEAVINTADAALGEASGLLAEAEALVLANANTAGLSDAERAANQLSIDSILSAVDRIAGSTTFNGDRLLDGSATVTVGGASVDILNASTGALGVMEIDGTTYTLSDIGSGGTLDSTGGNAENALAVLEAARVDLNTNRGRLGAFASHTIIAQIDTLNVTIESISAANSVIRDTDYAAETATLARDLVLRDASYAALALINSNRYLTLDLLGA